MITPFPGFKHATSHHCWTGSLRHIYTFYECIISEEMLLGLGEGVGFIYWHTRNSLPFLGGRANFERPGKDGLVKTVGDRTGVQTEMHHTSSRTKAERSLLAALESQQPVMLVLDMGFLPYFDFGGEAFHFGSHVVVACGYDSQAQQVLLADRDEILHAVSLDALSRARGSKFKPFPPRNCWFEFNFAAAHRPNPEDLEMAIYACADGMLNPPITNIGVKGIQKAAERIVSWPDVLSEDDLRRTCINSAFMIHADGGTGGGIFRFMYADFLEQVSGVICSRKYLSAAEQLRQVGQRWEGIADLFRQAYDTPRPIPLLEEISALLSKAAEEEEQIWLHLNRLSANQRNDQIRGENESHCLDAAIG